MQKITMLFAAALVAFVVVLTGCAPKAAPAPSPAAPQGVSPVPASPVVKPEDSVWQKVVEAAKKEGRVTLYANTFTGDRSTALIQAFKQRYGITAEILLGRGAEFVERLKTEKRSGTIVGDLFEGAPTHLGNAKLVGLMTKADDLPILSEPRDRWIVDPRAADPEGYILGYTHYTLGPSINSNLVKPELEPKSWKDLLDPKWKGKLIVYDPTISTGIYLALVPLMRAGTLSFDYVKELANQAPGFAIGGRIERRQ